MCEKRWEDTGKIKLEFKYTKVKSAWGDLFGFCSFLGFGGFVCLGCLVWLVLGFGEGKSFACFVAVFSKYNRYALILCVSVYKMNTMGCSSAL